MSLNRHPRGTEQDAVIGGKSGNNSFSNNMARFWKRDTNVVVARARFPRRCKRVRGVAASELPTREGLGTPRNAPAVIAASSLIGVIALGATVAGSRLKPSANTRMCGIKRAATMLAVRADFLCHSCDIVLGAGGKLGENGQSQRVVKGVPHADGGYSNFIGQTVLGV